MSNFSGTSFTTETNFSCKSQFSYVNYNPKDYKYGSQVGVILKRLYPGVVKIYDQEGRVIHTRAACSWNDYFWKKNECGVTYARLVKQEFWVKTNWHVLM